MENAGWTDRLEVTAPLNPFSNGYMVEDRDGSGFGFRTMPGTGNEVGEQLYYAIEITPTRAAEDPATGPRMTPMFDEVIVTYIVGETAEVIRERELTFDFFNE